MHGMEGPSINAEWGASPIRSRRPWARLCHHLGRHNDALQVPSARLTHPVMDLVSWDGHGESGQGSNHGNYIGTWLGTMGTREGTKEVIPVSKRREEEEEMRACRLARASAAHLRAFQQPREGGRSSRARGME